MFSVHFIEYAALAVALAGLAGVVLEIASKDVSLFGKIAGDVRAMATPVQLRSFGTIDGTVSVPANSNEARATAAA